MLLERWRFEIRQRSCRAPHRCASSAARLKSSLQAAAQQQALAAGVGLLHVGFMEMSRCCASPINIRHFPFYGTCEYICRMHTAPDRPWSVRRCKKQSHMTPGPLPPALFLKRRIRGKLSPNTPLMKQTYLFIYLSSSNYFLSNNESRVSSSFPLWTDSGEPAPDETPTYTPHLFSCFAS